MVARLLVPQRPAFLTDPGPCRIATCSSCIVCLHPEPAAAMWCSSLLACHSPPASVGRDAAVAPETACPACRACCGRSPKHREIGRPPCLRSTVKYKQQHSFLCDCLDPNPAPPSHPPSLPIPAWLAGHAAGAGHAARAARPRARLHGSQIRREEGQPRRGGAGGASRAHTRAGKAVAPPTAAAARAAPALGAHAACTHPRGARVVAAQRSSACGNQPALPFCAACSP